MGDRTKTMAKSDILNPSDPEESELTPKQLSAIEHLMMGKNMQVSAAATGVDVRTLRRWMAQKDFSAGSKVGGGVRYLKQNEAAPPAKSPLEPSSSPFQAKQDWDLPRLP